MDTFASRPAVPAPPPAYSTINRVTRGKSLRGVVMVCTIGGFIWSLVVGIDYMRAMGREWESERPAARICDTLGSPPQAGRAR